MMTLWNLVHSIMSTVHTVWVVGLAVLALVVVAWVLGKVFPTFALLINPIFAKIGAFIASWLQWVYDKLAVGLPIIFSSGSTIVAIGLIAALSWWGGMWYEGRLAEWRKPIPEKCAVIIKDLHKRFTFTPKR